MAFDSEARDRGSESCSDQCRKICGYSATQQIDIYFRYVGQLAPKQSLNPKNEIGRTVETVRPTYWVPPIRS